MKKVEKTNKNHPLIYRCVTPPLIGFIKRKTDGERAVVCLQSARFQQLNLIRNVPAAGSKTAFPLFCFEK